MSAMIGVVGAGRMGRGIALAYAFAGHEVALVDLKPRNDEQWVTLQQQVQAELRGDLDFLASVALIPAGETEGVVDRVHLVRGENAQSSLQRCQIVYEGVPEVREAKQAAFDVICRSVPADAIIASTTSTFLVTELAAMVSDPSRFLNAHWLNPAHLIPLVELSRGEHTSQDCIDRLVESLESIGKVPVVCAASPGYIVPRIQALAMNEAARLVEEGVASAEDVDKAVRYGFGLRFAVLGLLEFIDWGGGDILYYASRYLSDNLSPRFAAPQVISDNMAANRGGVRDGAGFYDYADRDLDSYRRERMRDLVTLLAHHQALPRWGGKDSET